MYRENSSVSDVMITAAVKVERLPLLGNASPSASSSSNQSAGIRPRDLAARSRREENGNKDGGASVSLQSGAVLDGGEGAGAHRFFLQ